MLARTEVKIFLNSLSRSAVDPALAVPPANMMTMIAVINLKLSAPVDWVHSVTQVETRARNVAKSKSEEEAKGVLHALREKTHRLDILNSIVAIPMFQCVLRRPR